MTELSVDFKDMLEAFGAPNTYGRPDSVHIKQLRDKIPTTLVDFWLLHGWCSLLDGQLWLPNPDDFADLMELIFVDDPKVDHTKCHLIAYSAFGQCWIWSEEFQNVSISLIRGWVFSSALVDGEISEYPDNLVTSFAGAFKTDHYDQVDSKDKKLFARAKRKYGALEPGECYGFFPAIAIA